MTIAEMIQQLEGIGEVIDGIQAQLDYHEGSRLCRVSDSLDEAKERLEGFLYLDN